MSRASPVLLATDWLFDSVSLRLLPRLAYWSDGDRGRRVLFIADEEGAFVISFEEGAEYHDYRQFPGYICAEQRIGNACLRQCRGERFDTLNNVCCFQLEWTDQNGKTHFQPGQMVTGTDYSWADGVEPVLLSIMTSLQMPYSA